MHLVLVIQLKILLVKGGYINKVTETTSKYLLS
jgi:hypothetical protein